MEKYFEDLLIFGFRQLKVISRIVLNFVLFLRQSVIDLQNDIRHVYYESRAGRGTDPDGLSLIEMEYDAIYLHNLSA